MIWWWAVVVVMSSTWSVWIWGCTQKSLWVSGRLHHESLWQAQWYTIPGMKPSPPSLSPPLPSPGCCSSSSSSCCCPAWAHSLLAWLTACQMLHVPYSSLTLIPLLLTLNPGLCHLQCVWPAKACSFLQMDRHSLPSPSSIYASSALPHLHFNTYICQHPSHWRKLCQ